MSTQKQKPEPQRLWQQLLLGGDQGKGVSNGGLAASRTKSFTVLQAQSCG